jgi:HAE1 family hydrophobic/amphiphilic exporter-1
MTLLALSLSVGLLIDDAIVVRENIFRHAEMGKSSIDAALVGTNEVRLAVIATTLTVIAVFGPIAFLKGVVGQFFKEFGLTVCFAMLISLFDALTIAPMLSAYFVPSAHSSKAGRNRNSFLTSLGNGVEKVHTKINSTYARVLSFALNRPKTTIAGGIGIFVLSIGFMIAAPKTFLPAQDVGEFSVGLDMPPGTNLAAMTDVSMKVDQLLRAHPEVALTVMNAGGRQGEANVTDFFVQLVPRNQRKMNTGQFKELLRQDLKKFSYANPIVKDVDMVAGGFRPFNLNIAGTDFDQLEKISKQVFEKLKNHPGLKDVDIGYRPGKPEFQIQPDPVRAERLGVSTMMMGRELRAQVEGETPAVLREKGREYDIRVRLKEDQRNLQEGFSRTWVPNINHSIIRLSDVARPVTTTGPANITRQDRARYIQISADIAPEGPGMGKVIQDVEQLFKSEIRLPEGMSYRFLGQAEDFKDLMANMLLAITLGILFIYLVLASLYESFVTPLTIMLVLPLAASGAFFAIFITGKYVDIFAMIGCILLLGIATKNSILLVDYTNQLIERGMERKAALLEAGKARLRPILMTSFALIAGMLPVAIGLNEASRQRTSMGTAVIGGVVSSTLLALVIIPAAYSYIEDFRRWSQRLANRLVGRHPIAEPVVEPVKSNS